MDDYAGDITEAPIPPGTFPFPDGSWMRTQRVPAGALGPAIVIRSWRGPHCRIDQWRHLDTTPWIPDELDEAES